MSSEPDPDRDEPESETDGSGGVFAPLVEDATTPLVERALVHARYAPKNGYRPKVAIGRVVEIDDSPGGHIRLDEPADEGDGRDRQFTVNHRNIAGLDNPYYVNSILTRTTWLGPLLNLEIAAGPDETTEEGRHRRYYDLLNGEETPSWSRTSPSE